MQVFELSNYLYMLKQYDSVNKMHSIRNKNLLTYNCSRIPNCPTSGPNK